jgi:hypothetical protein
MAIFNSYVKLPEGYPIYWTPPLGIPMMKGQESSPSKVLEQVLAQRHVGKAKFKGAHYSFMEKHVRHDQNTPVDGLIWFFYIFLLPNLLGIMITIVYS